MPHHVAASFGHVHMLQWLHTAAPIDVHTRVGQPPYETMLHLAALKGHMAAVQWLVGQGADVRLLDTDGRASHHAEADATSPLVLICGSRNKRRTHEIEPSRHRPRRR